jgi:ribonuclease G
MPDFLRRKVEDNINPMEDKIVISEEKDVVRVAIMRKGKLDDFFMEKKSQTRITGNICLGKVEKIIPSIQAAFVNIGLSRNGFLHISDIQSRFVEGEEVKDSRKEAMGKKKISEILKEGQTVMVQIIKDYIGTKGVRLSTNISLPGRYVVLMPGASTKTVSRKIEDRKERDRLKQTVHEISLPDDVGIIVRTAAEAKNKKIIVNDITNLLTLWNEIEAEGKKLSPPSLLHEELDIAKRVVRDMLTEEITSVVVDSRDRYDNIKKFIKSIAPAMHYKLKYYKGNQSIFARFGIEKELEKVFDKKIWLKCGGHIIIEKTEALVSVDVNTGRNVSGGDDEATIFQTNLEATEEVARQLRLRNMGGIIVIDYIDMRASRNKRDVLKKLSEELAKDKSKTTIYPFSKLGLVEMTRKRVEESWDKMYFDECPRCKGTGRIKSLATITSEVLVKLRTYLSNNRNAKPLLRANSKIIDTLSEQGMFEELEKEYKTEISYVKENDLDVEKYHIVERGA